MGNYMKWIDDGFKIGIHQDDMPVYKCPFCNKRTFVLPFDEDNVANFCPNCGKDLREDKKKTMGENNINIGYQEMEDALETMWFEDIITRNEYNIILDRLNKARGKE